MKRGFLNPCKQGKIDSLVGKPVKIIGISCAKRSKFECARDDPISLELLKMTLNEAEKSGAKTELIDLRELRIGACKECYSSCPAQCRFNEKLNLCDCYSNKTPLIYSEKGEAFNLKDAYDKLPKEEFLRVLQNKNYVDFGDDMWKIYSAMREADGIIFAGFTSYYSRPALMQVMFSRLCALDGGVEELWGDGKNLKNSIKYASDPKQKYKQRLYGKFVAFINSSKEGDVTSGNLMKACSMMGMRVIPFGSCYHPTWYKDPTHRKDRNFVLEDSFTASLAKNIGRRMVEEIKSSDRKYGIYSSVV